MEPKTGISKKDRKKIAEGLSRVLSESYILYLKTHNFHWNVKGPMFQPLHSFFEELYTELAGAVDEIAERIRALGFAAPGSFAEFSRLSSIEETSGVPGALDMVRKLLEGNETLVRTANSIIPIAQELKDEGTADLLVERNRAHEKAAWMLRSFLEK